MTGKGEAYKIYLGPFFSSSLFIFFFIISSSLDTLGVRGWSCGDTELKNGWWGNTLSSPRPADPDNCHLMK